MLHVTLATLILLAFLSPASAEDCEFFETFDGGFQHSWRVTDASAVTVENDVLRLAFRGLQIAIGGDHDDRDRPQDLTELTDRSQAIYAGQSDVQDDDVRTLIFDQSECLFRRRCREYVATELFPQLTDAPTDRRFVIHDQ